MHNQSDADQLLPMELPDAAPVEVIEPIRSQSKPTRLADARTQELTALPPSANTPLGSLAALFTVVPDEVPGVVLVDPRAIAIDPVNPRYGMPFNPDAHGELIVSMRAVGNSVPVRLRRDPAGGPGYLCPSGSRRLGTALHIQQDTPGFRLRAIIADEMSDHAAFEIAEADNAGRTSVSAMQQARHWAATLEQIYAGNRQEFIKATGRSASVVSRTLALLALPDYITACCADVAALTPYFAEQLVPHLGDPSAEPAIRRRAEALIAAGRRLPGAKLIRALLHEPASPPALRPLWQSSDGVGRIAYKPDLRGGGSIELAGIAALATADRREAVKAFAALLGELGGA